MSNLAVVNKLHHQTEYIDVGEGNHNETEREPDIANPAPSGQKRKRYVSKACGGCKNRKVRCTGEQPCQQCSSGRLKCEYNSETRRRGTQASTIESPGPQVAVSNALPGSDADGENFSSEMLSRLQTILEELRTVRESIGGSPSQDRLALLASSLESLITPQSGEACIEEGTKPNPDKNVFNGGPSILKPWNALAKRVGGGNEEVNSPNATTSPASTRQDCLLSVCSDISECYMRELRLWDANLRHQGVQDPCLDEQDFRESFERFESGYNFQDVTLGRIESIALVYSIVAVVKIVKDFCAEDNVVPGWYEFTRAEHLLNHIIRTGKGNLVTIQCLITPT
ncbi:Fungal Zn2Cys6 Cluster domain [Elasticomyces elasticus]|uniref:Zn(2)-C6 fungal-type domain-containing protein n=1 Tax=Exophiala sideris TaxID=1016849 RepID=A0ABR0IUG9_9EURO|nr:Fungal Zn2Cys6 Cluster domain [Elasticomyces elasticus]KAK5020919.1 hypothetical protein LTS07_011354 [Exophiala sideris]KAK5022981.1 Fungal Zn2Cys6 Cluster domain [Exophiala sideris]KAK5048466.1 hypothetical protein LTR69_011334 [Exophiala sideris]KAK5176038.1 hypothetical protein LTR44_011397 [Eurotiomycetes sp. CCFEE 6388]